MTANALQTMRGEIATTNLGQVARIKTGKLDANASSNDGEYPFFTCAREPLRISSYSYDCECVLVAGNGDLNVKYYFGKFDAYQRTYIIESADKNRLDTRYLYHFMCRYIIPLRRQAIGGIIKYIKLGNLTDAIIPLPPLPEQRRIAAILDKADALRQKRREAIAKLDQLLQSVFLEMFGDPVTNPMNLPSKKVDELAEKITSGSRGWAKYYSDEGAIFLRIQNLVRGELQLGDVARVTPPDSAEARRTRVEPNDVLVSITADLGRTAIVPDSIGHAHINQHLAILRLKGVDPTYVAHYLASTGGALQFQKLNRVGVKSGLNFDDLRALDILVPPRSLQQRYVNFVRRFRVQQSAALNSQGLLEDSFQSLQQRAFTGQL